MVNHNLFIFACTPFIERIIKSYSANLDYKDIFYKWWRKYNVTLESLHAKDSYCSSKAGGSQGRAPGQASDYTLRAPTILTVAPITRRFTVPRFRAHLTSPGPR